jgi:hypothetical protein
MCGVRLMKLSSCSRRQSASGRGAPSWPPSEFEAPPDRAAVGSAIMRKGKLLLLATPDQGERPKIDVVLEVAGRRRKYALRACHPVFDASRRARL